MTAVYCPYCSKKMRIITNLRTSSARSYFICDGCAARSPRATRNFVEDIKGVPTPSRVQQTIALVENDAYELATVQLHNNSVLDLDDVSFEEALKID